MNGEIDDFINKESSKANSSFLKLEQQKSVINNLTGGKIYCFRVDLDQPYSLCGHVIDNFCRSFCNLDAHLVLYLKPKMNDKSTFEEVCLLLQNYCDFDSSIQIIDDIEVSMDQIIACSDVYITGRSPETVSDLTLADIFDKGHIAGCAYPVF